MSLAFRVILRLQLLDTSPDIILLLDTSIIQLVALRLEHLAITDLSQLEKPPADAGGGKKLFWSTIFMAQKSPTAQGTRWVQVAPSWRGPMQVPLAVAMVATSRKMEQTLGEQQVAPQTSQSPPRARHAVGVGTREAEV